jgi:putative oxidoreductase
MAGPLQGVVSVVGRVLISTIFLMAAVGNKIPNYGTIIGVMDRQGVPQPQVLLPLAIVFLIAGSLSVILGYWARIGAALLAVFLVLATYYFHNFWDLTGSDREAQMIQFMKNLSMFGAMLFIIANGSGAWSLDRRQTS